MNVLSVGFDFVTVHCMKYCHILKYVLMRLVCINIKLDGFKPQT